MTIITEGAETTGLGAIIATLLEDASRLPDEITFEDLAEASGMAAFHVAAGGTPEEGGLIAEARLCEGMAERLGGLAASAKLAAGAAKDGAAAAASKARAAAERARSKIGKSYADAKEGYHERMVKAAAKARGK